MPQTLSVAMITKNEEVNLPRTLASVRWADEIVIADSGSTDRTASIAESFGAKVFVNAPFPGHGEQKNVAIDRCTSDWVLLLDADELISAELAEEIRQVLAAPAVHDAYWIPRLNLIFGRWMRHGGFYPDRKLRLFRRGAARLSEGVGPHSTPQFAGQAGILRGDMLHYAYPTLAPYIEHMNRYSTEMGMLAAPRKPSRSTLRLPLERRPQPSGHVYLELHLPPRISRWPRGTPAAHVSLGLRELEIREGMGAEAVLNHIYKLSIMYIRGCEWLPQ